MLHSRHMEVKYMKIIKNIKANTTSLSCNNHTGCGSDCDRNGGGLNCTGSVKD